jgi:catechol 2,3-dioxygenase-like lactoylglutathione lyase family enzyme
MGADDLFHVGIVVDDLDAALAELSALFGYEWCPKFAVETPVRLPAGERMVDLCFVYSTMAPRLEVIRSVPGTPWTPAAGSGVHHIGYWSEDPAADAARLVARGHAEEAAGVRPDGAPIWSYHRSPRGPRIELVSRELEPVLAEYWASA